MEFEIKHEIPCPANRTWDIVFSHEFEVALDQQLDSMVREIVSEEERDGAWVRAVRVEMKEQVPGVLVKFIGNRLGYILEERLHADELRMEWTVIPDKLSDRLRAYGDYRLVDSPNGCRRIVQGKVEADLPLVGGRFEKLIATELQASYDRSAEFLKSWLNERGE